MLVLLALVVLMPPALALLAFLAFLALVRPLVKAEPQPAREPIEGGSVVVSPESVTAGGDPVPVTITYVVGPEGIQAGGGLRLCPGKVLRFAPDRWRLCLQWANGWGYLQRKHPGRANHLSVSCSRASAGLEVKMLDRAVPRTQPAWLKRKFLQKMGGAKEAFDPKDSFIEAQKVSIQVKCGRLDEGDEVRFSLGGAAGLEVPYDAMETDYAIEVDRSGGGEFRLQREVPVLKATGGKPARLEVLAPSAAKPGDSIAVLARCLDGRGVPVEAYTGRLALSSSGGISVPGGVIIASGSGGVAWFRALVTGPGVSRIRARDGTEGVEGESNPVVCSDSEHVLLWGDLHAHSLVSDGTREPGYHYYRARYLLARDFAAVADHDIWSLAEEAPRSAEEFSLAMRTAEACYRPGEFVTFPCYEWTHHRLGHRNVMFGPGEEPVLLPVTDERYSTPARLLEALAGRNVLVAPHHPAWRTHYGEMHADFGPVDDPHQRLVEVYSTHGSSEFHGTPHPITHAALIEGPKGVLTRAFLGKEYAGRGSGSYVRDALAEGHRFGLIAGSDDHMVGTDPRKGIGIVYEGGLTGVFASSRTREAVWEGLRARRVCATTGVRMFLQMRVNGFPQGSELRLDSPPHLTGLVVGTADLDYVQVVKFDAQGYSIPWEVGGEGTEAVIDYTDRRFSSDSFYYLRVAQVDGNTGWAGPTWVDLAR